MTGADRVSAVPATGGSAPATPVLLLHCTGSTGGQWAALGKRLAPRFQAVTPDIAGWGEAGFDAISPQTLDAEAARLADRMAAFDVPFHLVGHSMGGAIAMRLALMQRARVKSLTLIEPVLFHLLRDGEDADRAIYAEPAALANRMHAGAQEGLAGSEAAMRDFVDYWNEPGAFDALDPSWRAQIAPMAARVAANFDALESASFPLSAVRAIAAPALLLVGSATRSSVRRIAAKLFDALPLAALATIHGAGHMLPFTHPGPVNDRILAHIEAVEGIGAAVLPLLDRAA